MVEFYFKLVKADKLTIDEVPLKYRDEVKARINEGE